jgi:hypothetical protein
MQRTHVAGSCALRRFLACCAPRCNAAIAQQLSLYRSCCCTGTQRLTCCLQEPSGEGLPLPLPEWSHCQCHWLIFMQVAPEGQHMELSAASCAHGELRPPHSWYHPTCSEGQQQCGSAAVEAAIVSCCL